MTVIQPKQQRVRINEQIRVPEVRLISVDGQQLGVMPIKEALALAVEAHLDLVEVAPQASPPVCRIMDYGKYKYEQSKKQQEARRKATTIQVKEIKVRPKIEEHDMGFKLKNTRRFLSEGDKDNIRQQMEKFKSIQREIFTDDYGVWIRNESQGNLRLNKEEMIRVAEEVAARLKHTRDEAVFMIPTAGYDSYAVKGKGFFDPDADRAFAETLKAKLPGNIKVIERDTHIDDPAFATEAANELIRLIKSKHKA